MAGAEVQGISLTRFAQLLALGALGLAGLLAFGVGGVIFVQDYAAPAPRIGIRQGPSDDAGAAGTVRGIERGSP